MLISVLQALAGLVLLFIGGECLVRGAVAIAHKFGMSSLSIGLTIVAFATSSPELAVSLSAALDGAAEISIGNVVGSNIANIGLILALSAVIHPMTVDAKINRIDTPIMLAAVVIMSLMLWNGNASRLEGFLLCAGLVLYLTFTLWHARVYPELADDSDMGNLPISHPILFQVIIFVLGLLMLVFGGQLLVTGAVAIATMLDISQAVIGLTVIAVGTSLPELATTLIATMRGYGGMAIGNIVGSNIFNIFGILGLTAAIQPLQTGDIGWPDLLFMTLISLVMAVFMFTRNLLNRAEGSILFIGYVLYTGWLIVF